MSYDADDHNGNGPITMPHVLELMGVSHNGPIVPKRPSVWSRITNKTPTGLILKDVSFEVHSSEMMAILGSKGSGKKTLLEVIGHRMSSQGTTRGQILLNDVPLTQRLFQEQCGYVSKRTEMIDGLTVRQTLTYMARMTIRQPIPRRMGDGSWMPIRIRVKQVMADVALSTSANCEVQHLNNAERKRLAIALQLIRDPLLLVLDDPCHELCPLDTYFIISMLSNHVKKYQRIVLFTMDKPRSDIFPFLDRVTFLCLGDVVYTGSTRMMMEYFSSIGFPCPELENPLMYYLCLSTVDRRTRDRFIESSAQIAALVDKFKLEGHEYRKYMGNSMAKMNGPISIPLTAYGKASTCSILWALICRQMVANFTAKKLTIRLGLFPVICLILYTFMIPSVDETQNSFQTTSSIMLAMLIAITYCGPAITTIHFEQHRNRFYEDSSRLSIYRGPSLIVTNLISNVILSALTVSIGGSITYWSTPLRMDDYWLQRWIIFCGVLWGVYTFVEQFTIAVMCVVKSSFDAALISIYLLTPLLIAGSTTLRSMLAASNALYYANWLNIYYWASWVLHFNEFQFNSEMVRVPYMAANNTIELCNANIVAGKCMFLSGNHFLDQRLRDIKDIPEWSLIFWKNFAFIFIFALSSHLINTVIYVIPLPASLKAKFRD